MDVALRLRDLVSKGVGSAAIDPEVGDVWLGIWGA
jgi:hypothetical protein